MKKSYLLVALLVLGSGAAAMLPGGRLTPGASIGALPEEISRANSGAFRDGLYLGKLTAERGWPRSVVIGRWATAENRALFTAGYELGYGGFVASHAATANGDRPAADCTTIVQRRASCELILN